MCQTLRRLTLWCAEDSTQANTVQCAESEKQIFKNPKLANTVRSQTLRRPTLREVRQFLFSFQTSQSQGI